MENYVMNNMHKFDDYLKILEWKRQSINVSRQEKACLITLGFSIGVLIGLLVIEYFIKH